MTDSQLLDKALDFIVKRERNDDYICAGLFDFPEENKICAENCEGLNRDCVLRFLKHYKQK